MLKPTVQRSDGWLLYAAPTPQREPREPEALLAWSAELAGGCKFASGPDAEPRVQAELPLLAEAPERVAAVEAGFAAAAARLGLGAAPSVPEAAPLAEAPDLAGLATEAGWPFEARTGGSLTIDLGVPGEYVPALIEVQGDRVSLAVELVELPEAGSLRRAAIAALLLRVNARFRWVRAVLREPGPRALLEVALPHPTSATELAEALGALSVAARASACEVRLLAGDDALARLFLDRGGMLPPL